MSRARPVGSLPATARVQKSTDFRAAQARGRRVRTPHFVLVLSPTSGEGPPTTRLGIVASRRVGNAVVRNRAKRLVREAFRASRDLFPPELDLIVIVTHLPKDLKLDDVVAEWRREATRIQRRSRQALDSSKEERP